MSTFIRWSKFNLVGVMGMLVQLATLALLNHMLPGHYLCTSAAALEFTLLHHFIWHLHFTWRDRRNGSAWLVPLLQFHTSNGIVSLTGNLVLVRILVHEFHVSVLVSNFIAILCCSVLNFCLSNNWAFAKRRMEAVQ